MSREWQVFLEPQSWLWLGGGLIVTIEISALVVAFSFLTGTLFALARLSRLALLRYPAMIYINAVRSTPVFLIIMFTFFGLPRIGINVAVAWSVTIALTIYATALIAEIVRAGILSVSRGQVEAARSLGINGFQAFIHIVFPQAMRTMVPPLVGQYIILIKSTSIGAIIGLDELLRRGIILYNGFQNPFQCLIVVAVLYFAFLFPLSMLSRRLELRDSRATMFPEIEENIFSRLRARPAAPANA